MKSKLIKLILFAAILILVVASLTIVNGEENFSKAEKIIEQKISCGNLTNDDLEILGDYFMEQMHPGELHEIMDERMGGEGSESLRQVHINMGRIFYCGESQTNYSGMMSMMMGRSGAMYQGMMNNYYRNYDSQNYFTGFLINLFLIVLIILVVVWIIKILFSGSRNQKHRK